MSAEIHIFIPTHTRTVLSPRWFPTSFFFSSQFCISLPLLQYCLSLYQVEGWLCNLNHDWYKVVREAEGWWRRYCQQQNGHEKWHYASKWHVEIHRDTKKWSQNSEKVNYTYSPLKERSIRMLSLPRSLQRNINNAAENLIREVQGERIIATVMLAAL